MSDGTDKQSSLKIDRWGLGVRIMRMVLREGKASGVIAAILTKEGFKLSQPTVSRYIKEHRKNIEPEVSEMVRNHVRDTVPADMDAVEAMEARALDWGDEEPETQAERIAAWEKIAAVVDGWIETIREAASAEAKLKAIKVFTKKCLLWVLEDLDNKKGRMAAMKLASGLIELKLRYAGIIDGAGSGNIFIGGDEPEDKPGPVKPEEKDFQLSLVEKKKQEKG